MGTQIDLTGLRNMKTILPVLAFLLLGACASNPPQAIENVPQDNPSLTRVRMDIDAFIGRDVWWGGEIARIENRADSTFIEIVRQRLRENGRPLAGGKSDGRFVARFDRFLDPVVYEAGRMLTVVGRIDGKTNRDIGEYDYQFPVVAVEGSFLWEIAEPVAPAPYPPPWYYYDPWYHPWPYHWHHH